MNALTASNGFGKTVVITGASAGIGRATALRFAKAGMRVGLIARDANALTDVQREIEVQGGRAAVSVADVADAESVFRAADALAEALGPIDIWINNAMATVYSPVAEMTPDEFARVTQVTYLGYVHGTLAALRHMRPRNHGLIVQVGSALAYRGIPLQSAYCGAKHAIRGFTNSLRAELAHERSKIKVTMVQLAAVNTPVYDWAQTRLPQQPRPMPPVLQPEAIADAIFYAAQKRRREYWVGRSTLEVIFANFLLPSVLDRVLARSGYSGQMTKVPVAPGRRSNLHQPVSELHRTRGSFGRDARRKAVAISGPAARLGAVIGAAAVALGAGAAIALGTEAATRRLSSSRISVRPRLKALNLAKSRSKRLRWLKSK